MGFLWVPKLVTLNDLDRRFGPLPSLFGVFFAENGKFRSYTGDAHWTKLMWPQRWIAVRLPTTKVR